MKDARLPANHPDAPALAQARAVFAVIASLITRPGAQLDALFAKAEALIARILLNMAIRESGRTDLNADMFDFRIVWRGCRLDFRIRIRPGYIPPLIRVIITNRLGALRLARVRRSSTRIRHAYNRLARRSASAQRRFALAADRRALTLDTPSARTAIPP